MSFTTAEKARFMNQREKVLARLQEGPVTNRELAQIALRYSSRLCELRQEGYQIDIINHDHSTGVVDYQLVEHLPTVNS